MVGPGAVVNVQYFKDLGGFDEGMTIWGGENLEFPWRVSHLIMTFASYVGIWQFIVKLTISAKLT